MPGRGTVVRRRREPSVGHCRAPGGGRVDGREHLVGAAARDRRPRPDRRSLAGRPCPGGPRARSRSSGRRGLASSSRSDTSSVVPGSAVSGDAASSTSSGASTGRTRPSNFWAHAATVTGHAGPPCHRCGDAWQRSARRPGQAAWTDSRSCERHDHVDVVDDEPGAVLDAGQQRAPPERRWSCAPRRWPPSRGRSTRAVTDGTVDDGGAHGCLPCRRLIAVWSTSEASAGGGCTA